MSKNQKLNESKNLAYLRDWRDLQVTIENDGSWRIRGTPKSFLGSRFERARTYIGLGFEWREKMGFRLIRIFSPFRVFELNAICSMRGRIVIDELRRRRTEYEVRRAA